MAINFPSSPTVNDLYVYNSITYKWDGTFWSPQGGGLAGFSSDGTTFSGSAQTVTTSAPILDLTQTWNAGGVTFTGIKANFTNTASAAASLLMDLQLGGSSVFKVQRDGGFTLGVSGVGLINTIGETFAITNSANKIFQLYGNSFSLGSAEVLGWNPNTGIGGPNDVMLCRVAAATLQHGDPDASTAVAQTQQVQSVVAGTSNTAGADWTFIGSKGTGTGAGGSIIFKTAPVGSTGTSQNTAVERLKIDPSGMTTLTPDPAVLGAAAFLNGYSVGVYLGSYYGIFAIGTAVNFTGTSARLGPTDFSLPASGLFGFASTSNALGTGSDTYLTRGAAAALQQGYSDASAAVAQTLQVQSVVAGTTDTAGANWTFQGSRGTGTGVGGAIIFKTAPVGTTGTSQNAAVERWRLGGNGSFTGGSTIVSFDLGTKSSGTLTPDYLSGPLQYVINGGAFTLAAPAADGSCILLVTNNGSAGAITFSGFSVGSSTGDALTTTNTQKFSIHIWRVNSVAGYRIAAHQ